MTFFANSKTEHHHRELAAAIPESQRLAYLAEFILDYVQVHGSAGLLSRFPGLAKTWESVDPVMATINTISAAPTFSIPHSRPGEVNLSSGNPFDAGTA